MISNCSSLFTTVLKSKVKKSAFIIRTLGSGIFFLHISQYSELISIPITSETLNIKLLFTKLPVPHVGSIVTLGVTCFSFLDTRKQREKNILVFGNHHMPFYHS